VIMKFRKLNAFLAYFLCIICFGSIAKADSSDYKYVPEPFSEYQWFESALDELHTINGSAEIPEEFDVSFDGVHKCTAKLKDKETNEYVLRYYCDSKVGTVYFSVLDYPESPYYQYQGRKEAGKISITVFDDGVASYRTYLFENEEGKFVHTSGGGDRCILNWHLFSNEKAPPEKLRKEIMSALEGTPSPRMYNNYFYWVDDINQYANQLGKDGASCTAKQVVRNLSSYDAFLRLKGFNL